MTSYRHFGGKKSETCGRLARSVSVEIRQIDVLGLRQCSKLVSFFVSDKIELMEIGYNFISKNLTLRLYDCTCNLNYLFSIHSKKYRSLGSKKTHHQGWPILLGLCLWQTVIGWSDATTRLGKNLGRLSRVFGGRCLRCNKCFKFCDDRLRGLL